MKVPKISVVMSCYNREHMVGDAIASILSQTYTDFEFIIIDDCSTDSTAEVIQQYADSDERIIFIKNSKNMDYNYNLRKGFELAKGEYIARMDDDDISLPERFAKQVEFMDAHHEITVLGTFIETFGDVTAESWITETDSDKLAIIMNFYNPMCHPSVMIRRAFLVKYNLNYSPDAVYAEEYDLWKNIIFNGGKLSNLPEVLLKYRVHPKRISSESKSLKIQIETARNVKKELLSRYFDSADVNSLVNEIYFPIQANSPNLLFKIFEQIKAKDPVLNTAAQLLEEEFCGAPCTMDIFFASDDNFAQHLCVAITSILVNSLPIEHFNFYVLDGGISEKNKKRITSALSSHDSIEFIKVDDSLFADCPITPECLHISKQTYYRYIIPKIKPHLERVLYLDCDIVVEDSLNNLWHTDLKECYAAVIEELYKGSVDDKIRLGINSYFNAGVMLINNKLWIQEGISDKLFENTALLQNKIKWVDQDVLNYTFNDNVVFVSPKYNLQQNAYYDGQHSMYSDSEMKNAKNNPIIIHYNGSLKPWQKSYRHLLWKRYFRYLSMSPFKMAYYKHVINNFPNVITNNYWKIKSFFGIRSKVLIFGTGSIAIEILPLAQERYDILAFIDNNKSKWGSEFEGYPIYSPDKILETDYDIIIVAIIAGFYDVTAQLLDMGVKYKNIRNSKFVAIEYNIK